MSTWLPPVVPPAVEELWLPTGHSDSSIDPYLVSCLEVALEKRRDDMRCSSAAVPMGVSSTGFRPAGDSGGDEMQGEEIDEDEDMDHDREDEDEDEIASDELSDDGDFTLMGDGRRGADPSDGWDGRGADPLDGYDGTDDETDDDDDDDDLAGYL